MTAQRYNLGTGPNLVQQSLILTNTSGITLKQQRKTKKKDQIRTELMQIAHSKRDTWSLCAVGRVQEIADTERSQHTTQRFFYQDLTVQYGAYNIDNNA